MEHIIKQLKKGAKHTRLSAVEKADMKSALLRHVKMNPVDSTVLSARGIPSPFFNINNFRNKKGISILVIGGLLMGGSVSFAAESTVPGDTLFPVKVHLNENVRGAVAVTSKAKAEWGVKLVERRLEEVEKLVMAPNTLPEVQQVAEKNLERYTERVKNRIEKFDDDEDGDDAVETALKLSDVYISHEKTLTEFDSRKRVEFAIVASTTNIIVKPVPVKDTIDIVRNARGDAEKKHKDLKEKYKKEKVEESIKVEIKKAAPAKTSKDRAENDDHKQKEESKEEISSTINSQTSSTINVTETQKEAVSTDDKKREDTHREESESDDKD